MNRRIVPSILASSFLFVLSACDSPTTEDDDDATDDDDGSDDDDSSSDDDDSAADDDDSAADDDDSAADDDDAIEGLGPWTGTDNVAASAAPPFGLEPEEVPMLVALSFDDNAYSGLAGSGGEGGMSWALEMLAARNNVDGTAVQASFYMTSTYIGTWIAESPTFVKRSWNGAVVAGHEIGNHTHQHAHGSNFGVQEWTEEIATCTDWLTRPFNPMEANGSPDPAAGPGADPAGVLGFRAPFLEYNDAALQTVRDLAFHYDTSIEDGWQPEQDGTNYMWPYTLDSGSPGHDVLVGWGLHDPITAHPGLWELPLHPVVVPPDEVCEQYGVAPGLRGRLQAIHSWFDTASGKITGFDYNLWVLFGMTSAEFVATLKYTLDQRLAGNRAPFIIGAHTDYYSSRYTGAPNTTWQERQASIEEFVDYALAKPEVRMTSVGEVLDFVRNPQPL
jgi:peptidoglycan/xylan/chitin deacetylase (PgdA/CDA1 family)